MILVDSSQEIVWPEATKSDPIDYNGEQNLVVCGTRQDLVYLLQGDTTSIDYAAPSDHLINLKLQKLRT